MYVCKGSGHNGAEKRNEIETPINMCKKIKYHEQMEKYWSRARERHKIQIIHVIQSFSKNEFDPKNPEDIQKANLVGQELVRKHYPGKQALVCTQTDGIGGCVHNHILINDVSMEDNKGCTNKQYHFESVRMWTDEITEKYTVLDFGEGKQYANKFTKAEKTKRKKNVFCWKDELRKRISEEMESAVSEEDFIKKLADNDVEVKKRYRKENYYLVYRLLDTSKISERDRKRRVEFKARDRKLGIDYGLVALDAAIESNKSKNSSANKSTSSDDV
ncbi:MAG: relaxase/mobilization nuclease domain-containing protein, partial [Oscillospiraceae bacterium]|nr:relaxase/mobilization nuclease domain-containing protein [Oscillospiraceae bacterium]